MPRWMLSRTLDGLRWLLVIPIMAVGFTWSQIRGTVRNIAGIFTETGAEEAIPPSFLETIRWLKMQVPLALGTGTARQQILASLVLAILMIVVSLGLLTWVAPIMLVPLAIGLLRLIPSVNRGYTGLRSRGRRTRSRGVRKWRRN